jgi:cytochrome P450
MLLAARDEDTGEGMNDRQVHDEVMTIFLAGHETTAVLLSWTWYILSRHPQIWERLRAELSDVLGGRTPTVEDLPRLGYTEMLTQEALRLYPPAWVLTRMPKEDVEIGGYRIPRGATIYLSPYVTHRHPAFWDNPEGVDPERFSPERGAGRPRYAYFPFGGGPRQCIGSGFALMEAQLVLATAAQRYRLELVPGQRIALDPKITLRPRGGLLMTLHSS